MKSTSDNNRRREKKPTSFGTFFKTVFGGEFLLGENMRPVYVYVVFLLFLIAVLLVGEQRIREKNDKIRKLETEYKQEISRLKSSNQFIPYEENKILIQKMLDRGYVFDERHDFTIEVRKPVVEKRRLFNHKRKKDEKE